LNETIPTESRRNKQWELYALRDAVESHLQQPPSVIKSLLLTESATLVSAHPKSMKSLSWLQACIESVAHKTVWGYFDACNVEKSLFIETEDPQWLVESRIRGFTKGLRIETGLSGFQYACPGPFDLVKEERFLRDLLTRNKPSFAVISTLQNLLAGRSWLQQDDMQPVMAAIIRLSRICPIVLLTHSPQDHKARRAAGTITQAANFVTEAHYQIIDSSRGLKVHVALRSKAGAETDSFHLCLETEGCSDDPGSVRKITFGGMGWPKGSMRKAVLAIIEENRGMSASDVAERANCSVQYAREMIREANKDGRKPVQ
jgi:hypothetical protein